MQNYRQSEFCSNLMFHEADPGKAGYPTSNVYMAKFDPCWEGYPVWHSWQPALAGHPAYYVNVIKLKWEIIWTGGLPHLPGVPHAHVNKSLVTPHNINHAYDWIHSCS